MNKFLLLYSIKEMVRFAYLSYEISPRVLQAVLDGGVPIVGGKSELTKMDGHERTTLEDIKCFKAFEWHHVTITPRKLVVLAHFDETVLRPYNSALSYDLELLV